MDQEVLLVVCIIFVFQLLRYLKYTSRHPYELMLCKGVLKFHWFNLVKKSLNFIWQSIRLIDSRNKN